jgi:hypothetical protein
MHPRSARSSRENKAVSDGVEDLRMLLVIALTIAAAAEPARVAEVRERIASALADSVKGAGVSWPPAEIDLRAFKHEQELEVWIGDGEAPLVSFETIAICGTSGTVGPKCEEGDQQIPEGLNVVAKLNSNSAGWLSLKLDYPNAADLARGARKAAAEQRIFLPGGDIAVHGSCISVGCIAIDDDPIERVLARTLSAAAGPARARAHLSVAFWERGARRPVRRC